MRSWLAWPSEEGAAVGVALPPVPCPLQRPHCGPFPHPGPALGRDGPGGPLAWLRGTVSSRRGWGLAGGMGPPRVWRPVLPLPREERLHKLHRPLRAGPPSPVSSEAASAGGGAGPGARLLLTTCVWNVQMFLWGLRLAPRPHSASGLGSGHLGQSALSVGALRRVRFVRGHSLCCGLGGPWGLPHTQGSSQPHCLEPGPRLLLPWSACGAEGPAPRLPGPASLRLHSPSCQLWAEPRGRQESQRPAGNIPEGPTLLGPGGLTWGSHAWVAGRPAAA